MECVSGVSQRVGTSRRVGDLSMKAVSDRAILEGAEGGGGSVRPIGYCC